MLTVVGLVACKPAPAPSPSPVSSLPPAEEFDLETFLLTFDARGDFEEDLCVRDLCEVSFLGLPETLLIRKGGIFAPHDYYSLWAALEKDNFVSGKRVLDLGTGSGPFALIAAHFGASEVVGTDVNAAYLDDARRNASRLGFADRMDFRLVSLKSPEAYSVLKAGERFDIILSNPPELDEVPASNDVGELAEKDPGYKFVMSMIDGLPEALSPKGQLILLYAGATGVPTLGRRIVERGLHGVIDLKSGSVPLSQHDPLQRHEDYGLSVPLIRVVIPEQQSPARAVP